MKDRNLLHCFSFDFDGSIKILLNIDQSMINTKIMDQYKVQHCKQYIDILIYVLLDDCFHLLYDYKQNII